MYRISDELETWPDRMIYFRVTFPWLLKRAYIWLYHQHNLFSFDQIILEFGDKVGMDEVFDEFENCPDQIISLQRHPLDSWKCLF